MYSLSQSIQIAGAVGDPIPNPFKGLSDLDIEFRRGELSVLAAASGTGKSVLALNLAIQANIPCLYFSADSTAATQLMRATAIITGEDSKVIKSRLRQGDFAEYENALAERWWIRFNYSARPTPEEIELHLMAYEEVFGTDVHLTVIDNISNLDTGGSGTASEYTQALEELCDYLNEMAREIGAHVTTTHHVIGEYADGLKPIPQSGIKGKVSRVPSLILTIHKATEGLYSKTLNVSPVKNRDGFADASGETFAQLHFNTVNIRLEDL
ncbi:AAA family ATPase [Streptomyces sp. NPDC020379]|uniref:AAA family ATPase n=1 Tax=Streptomyces sp. NPDC020379 TaxID=3365071 RepID=UPI0037B12245